MTAIGSSQNGHSQNGSVARALPISLENIPAEQSVIGAMLIEPAAIDAALEVITSTDFSRPGHQVIFGAITALHAGGQPADMVTVSAWLQQKEAISAAGGMGYLASLFDTVPTAANIRHYAQLVANAARLRRAWAVVESAGAALMQGVADTDTFISQLLVNVERVAAGGAAAFTRPSRKPFADTVVTFRAIPPPPADLPYLFGPYLNDGESHWLTGQNGIGKSTWLYNVLPALAAGAELWGIPTVPTRILYLDMESGDLGRSMKAQRLFPNRADDDALDNLFIQPEAPRFPADLPALLSFVQKNGVKLVAFDTARRAFAVKDENDNSEFYSKIVPILDTLKALGVATLTMGHPSKNGDGGPRGAGSQADAGDINLTLAMHGGMDKDDPNGILALRVTKNRLLGNVPPLYLRRIGDDQFERCESMDSLPAEEPVSKQIQCRQFIIDALQGSTAPIAPGALQKMAEVEGFKKATFNRAFKNLKDEGDVASHDGGYVLTDPFAN